MKRISSLLTILIMFLCITGCSVDQGIRDGSYSIDVSLRGGSGKAGVASPADITVSGDSMTAELVWSSEHYDYMIVDGEKYFRLNEELGIEGNSVFRIPVSALDTDISVIADTTAMSVPHEIEYTLHFDSSTMMPGKAADRDKDGSDDDAGEADKTASLKTAGSDISGGIKTVQADDGTYIPVNITRDDGSPVSFDNVVERRYAGMFTISYSDEGYYFIHIEQSGDYIVVPEGESSVTIPGVVTLCKPFNDIYMVSSAAMDVFAAIDKGLDDISFCSLDKKEWYVEEAVSAFDAGTLKYAGKYSAPDYELLLAGGCDLAVENTMIYHKPEVIEKLNSLGIPVIVEASSYEEHPFGRMEWIKLYGVLTDRLDEATEIFDEKLKEAGPVIEEYERSGTEDRTDDENRYTVAFFYVTSNGAVSVRKSSDYVSRMIEIAGGRYVPESLNDDSNALSSVNMQMESFYAEAGDADILIYNGSVVGEITSIEDLLDTDKIFEDFKAVKSGNVYTTGRNMYQETMNIPMMVADMNKIFTDSKVSDKELTFLKKVK